MKRKVMMMKVDVIPLTELLLQTSQLSKLTAGQQHDQLIYRTASHFKHRQASTTHTHSQSHRSGVGEVESERQRQKRSQGGGVREAESGAESGRRSQGITDSVRVDQQLKSFILFYKIYQSNQRK